MTEGSEDTGIVLKPVVQQEGGRPGPAGSSRSGLLFKGSLSGSGGGISGGSLHRLVGHDAGGKLLLGPLKAGACGAVQRVDLIGTWRWERRWNEGIFSNNNGWLYLLEHDQGHGGQGGEENGDDDHNHAHWDVFIQAGQSWDPPTVEENRKFDTVGRLNSEFSRKQTRFLSDVKSPHLVPQLVMPIHWIT